MDEKIRINKYIADAGICSRREADKLVEQGLVKVNGKFAESGTKVGSKDEVTVRGKKISASEEKIVLAFDPGYVNGCKIAVIDKTGKYLDSTVVKPFLKGNQEKLIEQSEIIVKQLIM